MLASEFEKLDIDENVEKTEKKCTQTGIALNTITIFDELEDDSIDDSLMDEIERIEKQRTNDTNKKSKSEQSMKPTKQTNKRPRPVDAPTPKFKQSNKRRKSDQTPNYVARRSARINKISTKMMQLHSTLDGKYWTN